MTKKQPSSVESGNQLPPASLTLLSHWFLKVASILVLLSGLLILSGYLAYLPVDSSASGSPPTTVWMPRLNSNLFPPVLTASSVAVYEPDSGTIVWQRNLRREVPPASTTKLMTALVALNHYRLDDVLTATDDIPPGSMLRLSPGERFSVSSLLTAVLVGSNNQAADMLAQNYPGGRSRFVEEMNRQAQQYGMKQTRYVDSVGFDLPGQATTAFDLAILAKEAIRNGFISSQVHLGQIDIYNQDATASYHLVNTSTLLGQVPGVIGLKTGTTENAGECLITWVTRDNRTFLVILMGSQNRFGETAKLIEWLYKNVSFEKVIRTNYPLSP